MDIDSVIRVLMEHLVTRGMPLSVCSFSFGLCAIHQRSTYLKRLTFDLGPRLHKRNAERNRSR